MSNVELELVKCRIMVTITFIDSSFTFSLNEVWRWFIKNHAYIFLYFVSSVKFGRPKRYIFYQIWTSLWKGWEDRGYKVLDQLWAEFATHSSVLVICSCYWLYKTEFVYSIHFMWHHDSDIKWCMIEQTWVFNDQDF